MWRRVIEVTNGSFSYNLPLACNHCVHPKCAGVCPNDAYVIRADGIVTIDSAKCMGCGYCAWACPYGAPQYDPKQGRATKCNFCADSLDSGNPPACVTACPTEALGFVEADSKQSSGSSEQLSVSSERLWEIPASRHPFPLPQNSRTQPHLAIKPYPEMSNSLEKRIANWEEINPKKQKTENSLIAFTLLAQTAVGGFWAAQWMFTQLWNLVQFDARLLRLIPYLIVGVCLGVGGLSSFAHLGSKRNAWRALAHLRKSWLSREVLYVGLFGLGWLVSIAPPSQHILTGARLLTSLFGIGLIYNMSQVYRLQTMPTWNTWRTPIGFFVTSILLGHLLTTNILLFESQHTEINLSPAAIQWIWGMAIALLIIELGLWFTATATFHQSLSRLRAGLIVAAILGAGVFVVTPYRNNLWSSVLIFVAVLAEEIIGRWMFYEELGGKEL